jgi:hypothetical protein
MLVMVANAIHFTPRIGNILLVLAALFAEATRAEIHTYGGSDNIIRVEVVEVYFLPKGRIAVPDWHDRLEYYARRVEAFHRREFGGQSQMKVTVWPEPFISDMTPEQIRDGDRNVVFDRTVNSVRDRLRGQTATNAFPIYLALSDINWRELDDFRRIRLVDGVPEHEGYVSRDGRHFPGAESGGARAAYHPHEHCGLGLVSADGWRVPYGGSDCVVYHEGLGHTLGLPHPDPMDDSVMGTAQYVFALNETRLDKGQKEKMGWQPLDKPDDLSHDLFSKFSAKYQPAAPVTGQEVVVKLMWPDDAKVTRLSVAVQTDLFGPWHELPVTLKASPPESMSLGAFGDATPVSYRVRVTLADGQSTEIWNYFQVRDPARRMFWYDYKFDAQSKRIWSRTPDGLWSEAYLDGRTTVFREGVREQLDGINGVLALRLPVDGFEVWIPDAGKDERWLQFRAGVTNSWSGLGAIHEVNFRVPPHP